MKTPITILALQIAALFSLTTSSVNAADIQSEIDLEDGVVYVSGDWTVDRISVYLDDDEVVIEVAQFESAEDMFLNEPSRVRTRDYDIADVDFISIDAGGGDDWVSIDTMDWHFNLIVDLGGGNDRLISWAKAFHAIDGGSGDDDIHCYGESPLDTASLFIYGSSGNDMIEVFEAHSEIEGGNGHDFIVAGLGADTVYGGDGDDFLFGGMRFNMIGNNTSWSQLNLNDSQNYIDGGDGNDFLLGGYNEEIDTLVGGDGADDFYNRFYERNLIKSTGTRGSRTPLNWIWSNETVETDLTLDFTVAEGDRRLGFKLN